MKKLLIIFLLIGGCSETKNKNEIAKDIFAFVMYNDGSLRPVGIYNWDGTQNDDLVWEKECDIGSEGGNPYCTGAIFENKFKVKYKY